ncbi:MAG: hypothetical protein WCH98_01490 [Verrucomicrobiota bacterium]
MKKINSSFLTAGSGKANPTLHSLIEHPMVVTSAGGKIRRLGEIVYVSTREEVERRDISGFFANFEPKQSRQKLRQLRGRIIFTVDGYDEDDEIYAIPDVRAYYSALHAKWPCWLFSACLASASLHVIALSVIPTVTVIRSETECRILVPEAELCAFFMHSLPAAALLNHRAGISLQYGAQYLKIVARHLGIVSN